MKKLCFLITVLLSIFSKAFGQAVAPAPNDLAVTAEIIGHSYKPAESSGIKPQLVLYVRLNVRNQTNFPRKIIIMTCSWDSSWINEGPYSLCSWECDYNLPVPMTIPANQSLIFYGPLCQRRKTTVDSRAGFALGFLDSSEEYFFYSPEEFDKYLKNNAIYWSNRLSGNIDPTTTPEIKGSDQYPRYYLSNSEK